MIRKLLAVAALALAPFATAATVAADTPQPTCQTGPDLTVVHPTCGPSTSPPCPTVLKDAAVQPTCVPDPCDTKPPAKELAAVPTCPATTPKPCGRETHDIVEHCPCATATPEKLQQNWPHPTCPPSSTPSTTASDTPSGPSSTTGTATPTGTTSTTATPLPTGTAASTADTAATATSRSTAPAGPALAHTGASVLPVGIGALVLLAAGGGFLAYTRRARRH